MGRRVSVGIAPAGFGGLSVDNNIIETAQTNQNLILRRPCTCPMMDYI